MAGEKTEKATPKRKQDERKKGNIFQSRELVTVFSLVIMFYSLKFLGPMMLSAIQDCMTDFIALGATTTMITTSDTKKYFIDSILVFGMTAFPLLLIAGLVAILFTFAQTKLLFSTKSMEFKASRLNPLSGIKRMFSIRGMVELVKSLLKVCVLGYIIYTGLMEMLPQLPRLMNMEPIQALSFLGDSILSLVTTTVAIFIVLAIGDYVYQWWDYEKNLRMSKDEIKEEYKQTEGDPQIKGKIKEKQRQIAMSRMMQNVPNADVVIRNPTHFAVAIQYDPDKNRAPIVVAKGMDELALRIVKVAEEAGVMITENKPLARGLYDAVELEREIPDQFYQAVAEVLAFVYSVRKKELK